MRATQAGTAADPSLGLQETEDKTLVVAFKGGDVGAYDFIYDRHSQRVSNICRRMLGNPDDAQEATQETFLRVYQALGRFNGRYQLGAWIARIATNVCLDTLRARTRKPSEATPTELIELDPCNTDSEIDPAVIYIRNMESRRVRRVLASLPPMHRAAIVLRDFEGLSYDEVAIALGITDVQVKALIHRARKGFKRSWPAEVASILLPWRLIKRLRTVAEESPDKVSHGGQVAQVASSPAANAVASCSGILQQCGQILGERAMATLTVVAMGTGVATGAAYVSTDSPSEPIVRPAVADAGEPAVTVHRRSRLKDVRPAERGKDREEVVVADAPEALPPPTTEPEPATEPEPEPAPEPTPTESGATKPEPSPTLVAPEPTGFSLGFDVALASSGESCGCLAPTAVVSESVTLDETHGIERFSQTVNGSANAAGTTSYGLALSHRATGAEHSAEISLRKKGGLYRYLASGGLTDRYINEWGGWVYVYEGSYSISSYPDRDVTMPTSGTYVVKVVASWRQQRVVETVFSMN
jgi:RNA polymerase sigma-70 factor (ECF subfamily)